MRKFIIVSLVIILLTFAMTFPLFLHVGKAIPGFESSDEPYGSLWVLWWMRFSSQHHLSFNSCNMIAFPQGMDFSKSIVVYPLWDFLNTAMARLYNEVFAYNMNIISGFILTGIFMYFFAKYLISDTLAAFASALIFTFCPYHFVRSWQHAGLANTQWMALYLFALFRLIPKRNIKNLLFALLAVFLVFSFDYYYAYFMIVSTVLVFLFNEVYLFFSSRKNNSGESLNNFYKDSLFFGTILSFCFLLILPVLIRIFRFHPVGAASAWTMTSRPFEDLFTQSARPLSYLLPSPYHPLFGKLTQFFIGTNIYGRSLTENVLFLGWIPLILAFIAVKRWMRKEAASANENFLLSIFIFLLIAFWLLSQPPWWNLGDFKLYMPSFFMYKIFPMFRAYCRFGILVMLAVSILAGFGLKHILAKVKNKATRLAVALFVYSLIIFEFWTYPPYKIIDVSRVPAVYNWLKSEPADTVIAEYPLDTESPNEIYKFYQTKHEKKMINGAIPRTPQGTFLKSIARLSDKATVGELKSIGVKYVFVHTEDYRKTDFTEDARELEKIKTSPWLKAVKTGSDDILVYEITDD